LLKTVNVHHHNCQTQKFITLYHKTQKKMHGNGLMEVGLVMNYWICCIFHYSKFGGEGGDEFMDW
jgi:hypothetical protein